MTDFSRSGVLVLRQHLEHHCGMHQQFVTNQDHCLKVLLRTDHTLGKRLAHVHSESRENHPYALHNHRHTLENRIKLIAKSMALRLIHRSKHTRDGLALGVRQIEVATMLRFSHPTITLAQFATQLLVQSNLLRNSIICFIQPNTVIKVLRLLDYLASKAAHETIFSALNQGLKLVVST